jgi:hypothetical protein
LKIQEDEDIDDETINNDETSQGQKEATQDGD